jgi:hypothetical protein
MKSMKVLIAALALCVLAAVPELRAQGNSVGKGKAHQKQIDKINTAVGGDLTAAQATQIDSILATAQAQVLALTPSDRRAKGGDIRKASIVEVRKQLNPGQQKKFDAMH